MTRIAPQRAYAILGVSQADDFATLRKAWVRLVKENHPDALGGDIETSTRRLSLINDAYDSLRWHNPEKIRIHTERVLRDREEALKRRKAKLLRDKKSRKTSGARKAAQSNGDARRKPFPWDKTEKRTALAEPAQRNPVRENAAPGACRAYRESSAICARAARLVGDRLSRAL